MIFTHAKSWNLEFHDFFPLFLFLVGAYKSIFAGVNTGLSLLEYPGLKAIDPAYALPVDVVNRIFIGR